MLLEVTNLDAFYGDSQALREVSLNVAEGEIVALLGRNGMGKSTTLKTIMGLVKPAGGRVVFKGQDLTGQRASKIALAGIGYVPEERRIFPNLSILDNLMTGVKGGKIDTKNPNAWTVERVVSHFPFMKDRLRHKGGVLSGGEQQMLTMGRTLMGNPDLVMVDEPTEGLSPIMVEKIFELLEDVGKSGAAILLVEHNFHLATSLATRVFVMGKAHVGFAGNTEELLANHSIIEEYLEV